MDENDRVNNLCVIKIVLELFPILKQLDDLVVSSKERCRHRWVQSVIGRLKILTDSRVVKFTRFYLKSSKWCPIETLPEIKVILSVSITFFFVFV